MAKLIKSAADKNRLPTGATLDPAEADAIATDQQRAGRALAYWRTVFENLEANPFGDTDSEAFNVIRKIPSIQFDRSADRTLSRKGVLTESDKVIGWSGCGVSGSELAYFLKVGSTLDDVLTAARTLEDAAKGAAPRRTPGVGVRACRELHDAVLRLQTARQSASPGRVTRAEALALHRQEGGLAVTPDARSYGNAPLTPTVPKPPTGPIPCRLQDVTYSNREIAEVARPGFNLVFRMPALKEDEAKQQPDVVRLSLLLVNAVVLGGLDILANSDVQARAPGDELAAIVAAALRPEGPLGSDSTVSLFGVTEITQGFAAGVAMIELESHPTLPEDIEAFLEQVRQRLSRLVSSHNSDVRAAPAGGTDVMLKGDEARDVRSVNRLQADWYGSRTDPETLRPWTSRSQTTSPRPGFSPFMTYLRFHLGDTLFMTTLLRSATRLHEFHARWRKHDARRWHGDFPRLLRNVGGPPSAAWQRRLARSLSEWRDLGKPNQHAWKVAGLVDRLRLSPGRYPKWAPASAPKGSDEHAKVAAVVNRCMDQLYMDQLLPVIGAALEWTPLDDIVGLANPKGRLAFANAHSFARLALVYDKALGAAGVAPDTSRKF